MTFNNELFRQDLKDAVSWRYQYNPPAGKYGTNKELAKAAGISEVKLSRIKRGGAVTAEDIYRLSIGLALPLDRWRS